MMFFRAELRHILRADHSKKAAALMILGLLTLAGVFMMAEAFHHHGSSTVTNGTTTDSAQCTPPPGSTLDDFSPIEIASASTKATFCRRSDESRGDGEVNSIHFDAFGRPVEEPYSTIVTTINPVTITSWSTTTSPRAATTFKTIFTTTIVPEASTALPIIDSISTIMDFSIAPLSDRLSRLNGEKVPSPTLTRSFTGILPLSLASHRYSEAGIFSTTTMSGFRIATYDPSSSSVSLTKEPDGAATIAIAAITEIATASTSSAVLTPAISSSTTQSLPVGYGGSMSPPVAISHLTSSDTIPFSSTTVMVESSKTSRIRDPVPPSSESQTPHKQGQPLPPNYNPFAATGLAPSGSLTALASALGSTPTQGVPSTPLSSIVAAISSSVATTAAALASASISLSLTGSSTQLQTVQPTSSPTATPLVAPSSDAKQKLTIALSVCIPILVAFAVFIAIWQRIRYVEKKRADDLEKDIIWVTPRSHTPGTPKENRTPRRDRTKGTRSAGSTPSTLARPDPTFMDGLNDVERAMVEQYQKKVAEMNIRKAAATLSSGRSPEKAAQRRSGGPMMRQGLDGTNDAPPSHRPSQIFTHHEDSLLNPFSDANKIGTAVSTPDDGNSHIRNALECYQPTRLSTITDKSGEIEMSEIPAPFGGAGSGPITQGCNVKGRLLERFIMKRKGLMPLDG